MTPRETRFILRTHRNDGRYTPDDPLFAPALASADASPELSAWLEREQQLDAVVAGRLEAVSPPADLRETILAGARASRLQRTSSRRLRWFAFAAAIAIIATVPVALQWSRPAAIDARAFAEHALDESAGSRHDHTYTAELTAIAGRLSVQDTPFTTRLDLTAEQLRDARCATVRLGTREAYEICFERDGVWFHLYVSRLDRPDNSSRIATGPAGNGRPIVVQRDTFAAAAWTDGEHLYSLVTASGPAALERVV